MRVMNIAPEIDIVTEPVELEEFASFPVIAQLLEGQITEIAIALSGGPDSMALCWLLSQLGLRHNGIKIHALTVDHALRAESYEEAQKVGGWVKDWPNVSHHILRRDSSHIHHARIQEDARHDRYALMHEYCAAHNIPALFVAHHANDQAETVLFRLAKGSGVDGLSGMKSVYDYAEDLQIFRPLLGVEKQRLVDTCAASDVQYVNDPSNKNDGFARIRLRKAYDVLAQEGLSVKRLITLANRMKRAQDVVDYYAAKTYGEIAQQQDDGAVYVEYSGYVDLPEEIRLRVMILAMKAVDDVRYAGRNGYGPRMSKLEDLCSCLVKDLDFKVRTLSGFAIRIDFKNDIIIIEKEI